MTHPVLTLLRSDPARGCLSSPSPDRFRGQRGRQCASGDNTVAEQHRRVSRSARSDVSDPLAVPALWFDLAISSGWWQLPGQTPCVAGNCRRANGTSADLCAPPRYKVQARNLRIPSLKAFRDLIECPLSDGFPGQPPSRLSYASTAPREEGLCCAAMTDPDRHVRHRCPRPTRRLAGRPARGEQEPRHRHHLRRLRHPLPALVRRSRPPTR